MHLLRSSIGKKRSGFLTNGIGKHGGCTITYVVTMKFYIIHCIYYTVDPILASSHYDSFSGFLLAENNLISSSFPSGEYYFAS